MTELTAIALNEQIVRMRKIVEKSRVRLSRRLIRLSKRYEKTTSEKKKRKSLRFMEEVKAAKQVNNDDIAKFALINTKPLKNLDLKGVKLPTERVFFKLAVEGCVAKAVEAFRKEYPEWQHQVPFLLQRLGLQYQSQNKKHGEVLDKEALQSVENEPTSSREKDSDEAMKPGRKRTKKAPKEGEKKPKKSPTTAKKLARSKAKKNDTNTSIDHSDGSKKIVELVKGEVKKAVERMPKKLKRKLQQQKKEKPAGPRVPVLPKVHIDTPIIIKGQGLIKKLNLNEPYAEDIVSKPALGQPSKTLEYNPSSSFFLPIGGNASTSRPTEEDNEKEPARKRKKKGDDFLDDIAKEEESSRSKLPKAKKTRIKEPSNNSGMSKKEKELESLHPSWAAKKRQGEMRRMAPNAKKIVFEDE